MNSRAVIEDEERTQIATREPLAPVNKNFSTPPVRHKALFEDSLLGSSSGQRKRRTWATIFSLILQCSLVGILILVPLIYTDVLPKPEFVTFLVAPPPPPPPAPAPAAVKVVKVSSEIVNGQLRAPSRIPNKILMIKEAQVQPPAIGVVDGVPGGIPGGQLGGVIGGIVGSLTPPSALPKLLKPAVPRLVRVSQGVTEGLLVREIEPSYPIIAKEARVQGSVVLTAIIAKDGTIQSLQLVSGSPLLTPAAIGAVKQWRYKPYLLSGIPVEVETTVTVHFQLG